MRLPFGLRITARAAGATLCAVGLALLWQPTLLAAAIAVELIAAAFWCWARAADDAQEQVPRWAWLRRPAAALWVALAVHATLPDLSRAAFFPRTGTAELLRWVEAIAVLWAGLELLAALPLARPYSDLPGPFLEIRPWLPVMLPAAGFVLLWRQSTHWRSVEQVREAAILLLLLTAVLGALRAFGRRHWTASLRWLAVSDSAFGVLLVASGAVPAPASFLLWLGACGGHAFLLAGELRGATPRRGLLITRMWRAATWTALAALSWPTLLAMGFGRGGGPRALYYLAAAIPTALAAWITVGRMVVAPERRRVMRPDGALTLSQLGAVVVLVTGPIALVLAWWSGFEPPFVASLLALAPAVLGGVAAVAPRRKEYAPLGDFVRRAGAAAPGMARLAFRMVVGLERRLVGFLGGIIRVVASPLLDLHSGDAQEYLLFLVGLGVLALVLPLLQ